MVMYDILPVLGSERGRGRRWRWRFLDWVLATAVLNKTFELFGLGLSFSGKRHVGLAFWFGWKAMSFGYLWTCPLGIPCPLGRHIVFLFGNIMFVLG